MGSHPDTEGYYTKEQEDFTFVNQITELPAWILSEIKAKNKKQGAPQEETTRVFGPNFAINSFISIERTIQEAVEAMWAMPPEAADDYDIWITIGQSLHSVDDTLLDPWDDWSKQSSKYKEGECHRRWLSFSKAGGRGIGSLFHLAKENGWTPDQAYKGLNVDDTLLEFAVQQLEQFEKQAMQSSFTPKAPSRKRQLNTPIQETKEDKKAKRNKSDDFLISILMGMYQGNFLFSQGHDEFFMYGIKSPGLWSPLNELEAKADIYNKLDLIKEEHLPRVLGPRLINDMYSMLKMQLSFDEWNENKIFYYLKWCLRCR